MSVQILGRLDRHRGGRVHLERPTSRIFTRVQPRSSSSSSHQQLEDPRVCHQSCQEGSLRSTSPDPPGQGCDRDRQETSISGVLLKRIPGSQEERLFTTSDQPQSLESTSSSTTLQDGNFEGGLCSHQTRRLGDQHRFDRRVLPCTGGEVFSQVPALRHQRVCLSIQGAALRAMHSSSDLHSNATASGSLPTPAGNTHSSISGRSTSTIPRPTDSHQAHQNRLRSTVPPGVACQRAQILTDRQSGFCLPGSAFSDRTRPHGPTRGQDRQDSTESSSDSTRTCVHQVPDVLHRTSVFYRETGPVGKIAHASSATSTTFPVGQTSRQLDPGQLYKGRSSHPLVDQQGSSFDGSSVRTLQTGCDFVHRRQPHSVGRSCRVFPSVRTLVTDGGGVLDQPTRTQSGSLGSAGSSCLLAVSQPSGGFRQHHGRLVHQQTGWHQVLGSTVPDMGSLQRSQSPKNPPQSSSHSGPSQPNGRSFESTRSDCQHRVDNEPRSSVQIVGDLGSTDHRSHGNPTDQTSTRIRLPIPTPGGLRRRRPLLAVDKDGRVSIPPLEPDPGGAGQDGIREELCSHPHRSKVAQQSLVSTSSSSPHRQPDSSSSESRSPHNANQRKAERRARDARSSRMQTIYESSRNQGFSEEVSSRVAQGSQRGTTTNIYDSKWNVYSLWCDQREIDPRLASYQMVADFLLHLFTKKRLATKTIKGYRTSINSVWSIDGRSTSDSAQINVLMKSFEAERPKSLIVFPQWDLNLVLRVLRKTPYEPLSKASILHLTRKTAFLLLLASARRVGDVHAIDPKRITRRPREIILVPNPGYLPKIYDCAEGEKRFQPIIIRRLSNVTSSQLELTLCPARALEIYDSYARRVAPNRQQFFLSLKSPTQPVKKQTMSGWVAALIRDALATATDDDCRLAGARVHEIRAMATSMVHQSTFALNDIMAAATWATPSVFTSHYLRDMTSQLEGLNSIGPVVTAGAVLR
jgi:hypothetical protein